MLASSLSSSTSTAIGERPRRSRRIAVDLVAFADLLAVAAGGFVPAAIYSHVAGLPVSWAALTQACLVTAAITYGCLANAGMYDTSRMHDLPLKPGRLAWALAISFVAVLGLGLPFAPRQVHLWVWYGAWMSTSFALLLNLRLASRWLLARLTADGVFDRRVAVYGGGIIAGRVDQQLRNGALGIRLVGVYDDRPEQRLDSASPAIAGRLEDLVRAARSGAIDQIVIALPQGADQRTADIARRLEHLPVSIHIVTHIASDLVDEQASHTVSSLGTVGLIDVKAKPLADWSGILKAVEDYVLGAIFLLATLPLLAVISLIIKLDSAGPVLFRQKRAGRNGQVFECLKFRTMTVLEDGPSVLQARRDDPRVTRVGRVLRMTSLDELPQLINVLRGEMSIVGPRPHALAHDERFAEIHARYANRSQVKPGITGLAQINGHRGETETIEKLEARLAEDLAYVNTWSIWLDLKIIARTMLTGLVSRNAY